jgi:UDP-N-acetylglucosamine--N-acetylmuramyl-(pentapeptide) pyrophosphoryl-undecaprenol N-acetylglucosamine transferase
MTARRVIISGGGTGGHLFPALVVGRKLLDLDPGLKLTYVGTDRDVEKKIMAGQAVDFVPMKIEGLKGRGIKSVRALFILPGAFLRSLGLLLRLRPALVIGVGGYSSGPIVLLASWFRVPTLIMEQNAHPGFTNRLLARWVGKAVVAFETTLPDFRGKGVLLGNPVREEFYAKPARPSGAPFSVLIFGGSQGARVLNETAEAALPLLRPFKDRLRLTHQTGSADFERTAAAYRAEGFEDAVVAPFFPDMPARFHAADLLVSRAGATTLAEIIAAGKAAVLVPFAGAAEDHQTKNARELASRGAAELIPEKDLTPELLASRVIDLLEHRDRLEAMEKNLGALRLEDPAGRIARLCLDLMTRPAKEARP